MYILDTDFIIDFLRGEKRNVEIISNLLNDPLNIMFTASITSYELTKGCYKSARFDENFDKVMKLKNLLYVLEFDADSSLIAAEIFHDLEKKGMAINEFDVLIAGICLKNNFTLVTCNAKHFKRIKGLRVIS